MHNLKANREERCSISNRRIPMVEFEGPFKRESSPSPGCSSKYEALVGTSSRYVTKATIAMNSRNSVTRILSTSGRRSSWVSFFQQFWPFNRPVDDVVFRSSHMLPFSM